MWNLFTENLNKSSKKKEKNISNKIFKQINDNLKDLKFGEGTAISKKNIRNFSKGNVFIENKLDLHGYNQIEAKSLLKEFISSSIQKNYRLILVITGKGKDEQGVIKSNILTWLNSKDLRNKILAVNHASKKHGGQGAIYIFLKKFD